MRIEHAPEGSCSQARRREICQHLHLCLPASSTMRNKCLLFKPQDSVIFVTAI